MTHRQLVGAAILIFVLLIFATWRVNTGKAQPVSMVGPEVTQGVPAYPRSARPMGCILVEEEQGDPGDPVDACPEIMRVYRCKDRLLAIVLGPHRGGCAEMRFWKPLKTES